LKKITEQSDILYYTAKETGLTFEQVRVLEREFWKSLRYYLSHPLLTGKGIMISKFMKFFPKQENLYMARTLSKNQYLKIIYNEWTRRTAKKKK